MATTKYSIDIIDGWVKVVDASDPFILENGTAAPVKVAFGDSEPNTETSNYHLLRGREGMVRAGVAGDVYVQAIIDGSSVVVSK